MPLYDAGACEAILINPVFRTPLDEAVRVAGTVAQREALHCLRTESATSDVFLTLTCLIALQRSRKCGRDELERLQELLTLPRRRCRHMPWRQLDMELLGHDLDCFWKRHVVHLAHKRQHAVSYTHLRAHETDSYL